MHRIHQWEAVCLKPVLMLDYQSSEAWYPPHGTCLQLHCFCIVLISAALTAETMKPTVWKMLDISALAVCLLLFSPSVPETSVPSA